MFLGLMVAGCGSSPAPPTATKFTCLTIPLKEIEQIVGFQVTPLPSPPTTTTLVAYPDGETAVQPSFQLSCVWAAAKGLVEYTITSLPPTGSVDAAQAEFAAQARGAGLADPVTIDGMAGDRGGADRVGGVTFTNVRFWSGRSVVNVAVRSASPDAVVTLAQRIAPLLYLAHS